MRPTRTATILGQVFVYRVATSMGPLAILLTVTPKLSLSAATYSLTCWTLAGALSQPIWIAVAERAGHRLLLLCLGFLTAACHVAVGVLPGSIWTIAFAGLAGATLPPITALARALLACVLEGDELKAAFDMESALASSAFIVAPLLVAASSAFDSAGALASCALLLAAVSSAYAQTGRPSPRRTLGERDRVPNSLRIPTARSRWPSLVLVVAGFAAYAMLACIEVAAVARLTRPTEASLVLCAWATVSVIAGMVFGRSRRVDGLRIWLLTIPAIACVVMAFAAASHGTVFVAVLILSGIAVAPTLALIATEVSRVTPVASHSKVFGWLQASSWMGSAVATAIAGAIAAGYFREFLLLAAALSLMSAILIVIVRSFGPTVGANTATSRSASRRTT